MQSLMANTGVVVRGGKLLNENGKVNVARFGEGCFCCGDLPCNECEFCAFGPPPEREPCDKPTESPGCPTDCCTPRTVRAVVSGWNASICTQCYECSTNNGVKYTDLSFDGTYCLADNFISCPENPTFTPTACNWLSVSSGLPTPSGGGRLSMECFGITVPTPCSPPISTSSCVVRIFIFLRRLDFNVWRVQLRASFDGTCPLRCTSAIGTPTSLFFEQFVEVENCKDSFVITNTTNCGCLGLGGDDAGNPASAGTITFTPCFSPSLLCSQICP